jgi:hypothetical protein
MVLKGLFIFFGIFDGETIPGGMATRGRSHLIWDVSVDISRLASSAVCGSAGLRAPRSALDINLHTRNDGKLCGNLQSSTKCLSVRDA